MHSLIQDIRFSLRLMRKRPGMTFLVLAALVLGIGANSAVFSVVDTVLLRPLTLPDADRLVFLWATSRQFPTMPVSYPEYLEWKRECRSFQGMTTLRSINLNLTGNGVPEHLTGARASASFFRVLDVPPILGRDFTEDDDRPGAARVAIIGHGLWERRFGGDPAIVGKSVILDDQAYTVVGVGPANPFPYIRLFDVWLPTGLFFDQEMMNRNNRFDAVIARLNPSTPLAEAQAEMETISRRLAVEFPQSNAAVGASVVMITSLITESGRKPVLLMQGASCLILLLACVNVMTVFVASTIERRKELSVRMALGADRAVLVRQLFVHSILFAVIGSVIGLALAKAGLTYMVSRFPYIVARFRETSLRGSVIWFTVCTALVVSIGSSLLPALYAFKIDINSELKGDWSWPALSRYRVAGQSALVVFEVSLAASLSLVSALLIRSLLDVERINLGFSTEHVLSFQVSLPPSRYKQGDEISRFYERAIREMRALSGVRGASAISTLPLSGNYLFINLQVDGEQADGRAHHPYVDYPSVLPGYFSVMKNPILQGRDFSDSDRANAPFVAIVDDVLASRMWPKQSPLGKRIRLADEGDAGPPWREVVGVVHQVKHYGPEEEVPRMQVYVPLYQQPVRSLTFVVDSLGDSGTVKSSLEKSVYVLDKDLPLDKFLTLDDLLSVFLARRRVSVLLLGSFAAIGLSLAMIGIYGVVSNSVVRRRREIAIRMALGANIKDAIIFVTKVGVYGALGGILISWVIVFSLTNVLSAFLFGVTALDFPIYLLSAAVVLLLTLLACIVPALALFRLNPQEILREQ